VPWAWPWKTANSANRHRERRPRRQSDQQSQHRHRSADAGLDPRHGHAAHAEQAAGRHRQRKSQRQNPQRTPPDLRRPEADRHHGENVIEAGEGMRESLQRACMAGVQQMRLRRYAKY
jgi:hypothetical protein